MKVNSYLSELWSNRTLTFVSGYSAVFTAIAFLPLWISKQYAGWIDFPSNIHVALGIVLGWLLSFRTNVSHARWWEARTLWGSLVNTSRNLAIKVADLVRAADPELEKFRIEIIAFAVSLRDHLRGEGKLQRLVGFEHSAETPTHVPGYLVTRMYEELSSWKKNGYIDGHELQILDEETRKFLDICGACERIRHTKLIRSYRTFARQCVILYLLTFPWGIVSDFGVWVLPLTLVMSYFMLGLEIVAEHVEEPFGRDEDDLDLDGLCRTIERSVNEIFARRLHRMRNA